MHRDRHGVAPSVVGPANFVKTSDGGYVTGYEFGALVHDGASQVMGPVGGVVMRPDAGVNLRNDDLCVGCAKLIDFLGEQRGGVNAMRADFDFLCAVARNQL